MLCYGHCMFYSKRELNNIHVVNIYIRSVTDDAPLIPLLMASNCLQDCK